MVWVRGEYFRLGSEENHGIFDKDCLGNIELTNSAFHFFLRLDNQFFLKQEKFKCKNSIIKEEMVIL
jgi:hypothetical protein